MYKRIIKSLSHHIDSALRLHFSRRNERVPAEVCPVVYFAGTSVAIAISVRLRLCPPKPSASLHPGASRHPFTWPWAAMGLGGQLPAGHPVVFPMCDIRSEIGLTHTFPFSSATSGKPPPAPHCTLHHIPIFPMCHIGHENAISHTFHSSSVTSGKRYAD